MWNKVGFNAQNIERETAKATLIKMPKSSEFSGWMFWHPSSLIRNAGGNGYWLTLSFTDDWDFTLIKGKGQYRKEMKVSVNDILESFNGTEHILENEESYLEVTEPDPVNKKVEVHEELKR